MLEQTAPLSPALPGRPAQLDLRLKGEGQRLDRATLDGQRLASAPTPLTPWIG